MAQYNREAITQRYSVTEDNRWRFINSQELSIMMGISYKKALEVMKTSGFPAIRIGGEYRVSREAFERWTKQNEGKEVIL